MSNRKPLISIEGYSPDYIEITRENSKKELYMRTAEQMYAFGRWIASEHPNWMYMWDEKPVTMNGNAIICPVELIVIRPSSESAAGTINHHSLGRSDWTAASMSAEDIATARTFAQGRILRNLGFSPYGFGEDPKSFYADRADAAEHNGVTHSTGMPVPNDAPAAEETKQNAKNRNPMLRATESRGSSGSQNASPAPTQQQNMSQQAPAPNSQQRQTRQQAPANQSKAPAPTSSSSNAGGMTVEKAMEFVVQKGKKKGRSIRDLCANEPQFVKWVASMGDQFNGDPGLLAACTVVAPQIA